MNTYRSHACGSCQLRPAAVVFLLLALGACGYAPGHDEVRWASLIQLIADPENYDRQVVTVAGVLRLDSEATTLYFSEADARYGIPANGVWLRLDAGQKEDFRFLAGRFVMLKGRFSARHHGPSDLYRGSIGEIEDIMHLPTDPRFQHSMDTNKEICCDASHRDEPQHVSLLQLITAPETFGGKTVVVVGFLSLEFEGTALFLHEVDFANGLTKNGVWLSLEAGSIEEYRVLDGKYVIVEGRFDQRFKGHLNLFSGTVTDITRIES